MWGDSPPDECQGQVRAAPSVTQPVIMSVSWLLSQQGEHEDPRRGHSLRAVGVPGPLFPKQGRGAQ